MRVWGLLRGLLACPRPRNVDFEQLKFTHLYKLTLMWFSITKNFIIVNKIFKLEWNDLLVWFQYLMLISNKWVPLKANFINRPRQGRNQFVKGTGRMKKRSWLAICNQVNITPKLKIWNRKKSKYERDISNKSNIH